MLIDLNSAELFENRHQGKSEKEIAAMCASIGVSSPDELIAQTIPSNIRSEKALNLPAGLTEVQFQEKISGLAAKNKVYKTFIGCGYYDTVLPKVVQRNILENPAWYTAYTPYQAEIAQGRLEMLLTFQTVVVDLTGMEIANASLLDEATAAGEAMSMLAGLKKGSKKNANTFFVSDNCHPQVIDVVKGRAKGIGVDIVTGNAETFDFTTSDVYGVLIQNPGTQGEVKDYTDLIAALHEQDIKVCINTDLLSLTLFKSPGEMGADIAVGTSQRLGVPMGYGGPHAAFFATRDEYKRQIPGRIIGVSVDAAGNRALRMALQTREQHIRREKATSNICTAQVLLSVLSAGYCLYHGPEGLKRIASKIHGLTTLFANSVQGLDYRVLNTVWFDTVTLDVTDNTRIRELAEARGVNLRYHGTEDISISFDETKTLADVALLLEIFSEARGEKLVLHLKNEVEDRIPENLRRTSTYLQHPIFSSYQTEHEMLRYLKALENKDLSLVHSMISLGSCTMKLNATSEMLPITLPGFAQIHPFAPKDQTEGYQELFRELEAWLAEITGFAATSLQPNSGAQGELAGLMVIKAYFENKGENQRNIALIPSSAHGTNPASAVMAGLKVVVVKCDEKGNIEVDDLRAKAEQYADTLACLMVTYPSTHGVFEESIIDICDIIHGNGGKVYMDGANMNAQVGLTSPGRIGADVCHLNLHKTFSIPHGGGGPGIGPICCTEELAAFLPGNALVKTGGEHSIHAISAAPWGSAGILPIPYAFIAMMGGEGLTRATKYAIFNANYIKSRLEQHFTILYTGTNGRCAHEMIVDCRPFKIATGVEVEDIAKRLMDYGFHAPTVSFPVAGTLMIEPTESESQAELDRFCDALIAIRREIAEIEEGLYPKDSNVLVNAPHTLNVVMTEEWVLPYSREKAAFPAERLKANKFWPSVSRVDSAYGDRNLVCACEPIETYQ
ncbi:MAG: aminomethyl-transferring glycine dehydrogenase [Leadbetterella sp.]|nr:aminomethyl-transferring glycine dehydrogenase [Leadbetterella sp.]